MTIAPELLRRLLEGALLASAQPLSEDKLLSLLDEEDRPSISTLRDTLGEIAQSCDGRGFELKKVASGWRFQVPEDLAPWVNRLWEEKAQRYSRATLETLAIVAYRQPVTRGDIEEIRGVAVSSQIVRTLLDRGWIKVVGHRDVPGKPSLYATTRDFLDYFNLASLDELPTLAEVRDIESLNKILEAEGLSPEEVPAALTEEGEDPPGDTGLAGGDQSTAEAEEVVSSEESIDAAEDALVAAALEDIAAETADNLEAAGPVQAEMEAQAVDDVVLDAAPSEALEDTWELAQVAGENLPATEPRVIVTGEEPALETENESEIEQEAEDGEPAPPIAAALPKSSLFGDIDTETASGREERDRESSGVDDDSQDVVQAENTTP
ncbi:SMC-Scp complex subunit ScpB [uncultured Microbulbifer sp.]|uniref:SMC-Scp complex subunit ScpB n=1 Tax=uncultured Microbulbifer sp. TaxID=348147 RepID=UPI00261112C6|nr:SMC-Scp complex subunit ScpB [uncultured Microbulbifer sp.]